MATNDSTTLNIEAGLALITEINQLADTLKQLCSHAVPQGGDLDEQNRVSALVTAAEKLAGVIGWHSERCAKYLGGTAAHSLGGDADYWMSPNHFRTAIESNEVRHAGQSQ